MRSNPAQNIQLKKCIAHPNESRQVVYISADESELIDLGFISRSAGYASSNNPVLAAPRYYRSMQLLVDSECIRLMQPR
jgi:hypothetical protein